MICKDLCQQVEECNMVSYPIYLGLSRNLTTEDVDVRETSRCHLSMESNPPHCIVDESELARLIY